MLFNNPEMLLECKMAGRDDREFDFDMDGGSHVLERLLTNGSRTG